MPFSSPTPPGVNDTDHSDRQRPFLQGCTDYITNTLYIHNFLSTATPEGHIMYGVLHTCKWN